MIGGVAAYLADVEHNVTYWKHYSLAPIPMNHYIIYVWDVMTPLLHGTRELSTRTCTVVHICILVCTRSFIKLSFSSSKEYNSLWTTRLGQLFTTLLLIRFHCLYTYSFSSSFVPLPPATLSTFIFESRSTSLPTRASLQSVLLPHLANLGNLTFSENITSCAG
jgi:hypothetical protein